MPLAMHYLTEEKPGLTFSREAIEKLCSYAWPGNVRELRNAVVRAAILAPGTEVAIADLSEELSEQNFTSSLHSLARLDVLERSAILKALDETDGHQQKAANKLGISKRTLQRKIKSYALVEQGSVSLAR